MAIKFQDKDRGGPKSPKTTARDKEPPRLDGSPADEANPEEVALPFAKPVRAEKKGKKAKR